ncbi:acyltransferase family protein [Paraburkholderia bannensis]|uniref:acyltransferase family protein n=1 Tax=Paraburkholderia bannensis TaxID=765414 RepID=UPI002AB6EA26|nr:acyltransferase [Paraburkholderia bannensis]
MKREIEWIQALRGIAALLVVICHARIVLRGTHWEPFSERALTPGALGVDLFFMISGFIMVHTTRQSDSSLRYTAAFLIKRFTRIWPVYVVAIIASLIISPPNLASASSLWSVIEPYIKQLLFIPVSANRPPFFSMPYDIGWTLNFEVYFYLVFGISLLFGRFRWTLLALWFALTLIAAPLYMSGHAGLDIQRTNGFSHAWLVMISNPIIWEFAVGVAIGLLYHSELALPRHPLTYCLLVGTTTFAVWYDFSWHGTFNGLDQWGAPLIPMLIAFALASKNIDFVIPASLLRLGAVSYSLYLFHPIASKGLRMLMAAVGLGSLIPTWWCTLAVIVFAIIVAALSHRILERGLSGWLRKRLVSWTASALHQWRMPRRVDCQHGE